MSDNLPPQLKCFFFFATKLHHRDFEEQINIRGGKNYSQDTLLSAQNAC